MTTRRRRWGLARVLAGLVLAPLVLAAGFGVVAVAAAIAITVAVLAGWR